MVESKLTYEECRRQRVEENKKRMEELNLKKLSLNLQANAAPKPSPAKPKTPRQKVELTAVRRSSRVADKPAPNYKEGAIEPLERPRRFHSYKRRDLSNRIYASDEVRQYAIERAEQLQSSLDADFPSFLKPMLQSHVTGGFWLGLPLSFCRSHLPKRDEYMTLVDEDGDESEAKYLSEKNGLSGGWRGFAIDHGLVDGDALVFQLTTPTEFKVNIIRAYSEEKNEDEEEEDEIEDAGTKEEEEDVDIKDEVVAPSRRSSKRIKRRKDPNPTIRAYSEGKNEDEQEEDEIEDAGTKDEEEDVDIKDEVVAPSRRSSKHIKRSNK